MEELGADEVFSKIGTEPTGRPFSSIPAVVDMPSYAGNPYVNAGAIATASLISGSEDEKWNKLLAFYGEAAKPQQKLSLLEDVYKSEAATNTGNKAISMLLAKYDRIYAEPFASVDVYTKACSIGVTAYQQRGLAKASGIETPTREDLARLERKKRTSNQEWKSPADQDTRIAKMKDGRTQLAHTAEHGIDMDTGAVGAVTLQAADRGDPTTLDETLCEAGEQLAEQIGREAELHPKEEPKVNLGETEEWVTDKGYHSGAVVKRVKSYEVRSYIPEKKHKGRRHWQGQRVEQQAVY